MDWHIQAYNQAKDAAYNSAISYHNLVSRKLKGEPVSIQDLEKHQQTAHETEIAFRLLQFNLISYVTDPFHRLIWAEEMDKRASASDRILRSLDKAVASIRSKTEYDRLIDQSLFILRNCGELRRLLENRPE